MHSLERWTFWFKWALADTVGLVFGVLLGITIDYFVFPHIVIICAVGLVCEPIHFWLILGIITGFLVGVTEWLVLRPFLNHSRRWILMSLLGWMLGFVMAASSLYGNSIFLAAIMLGGIVGTAQWFILRTQFSKAYWWIPVRAISGVVVYGILLNISDWGNEILLGLINGLVTGLPLLWLLQHPLSITERPKYAIE